METVFVNMPNAQLQQSQQEIGANIVFQMKEMYTVGNMIKT